MTRTYKIAIEGMHCHACERLVTANLSEIEGVTVLHADAQDGYAIISADTEPDADSVASAITAAGFTPAGGAVTLEPVEWTGPE
ncbi:MAG: heavy metal-associated domain-containing protein, partial [Coriobacteriia bacterium]